MDLVVAAAVADVAEAAGAEEAIEVAGTTAEAVVIMAAATTEVAGTTAVDITEADAAAPPRTSSSPTVAVGAPDGVRAGTNRW